MGMCVTHPGAAGGDSPWRRRGTWRGRPPWRRSCRARTCRKPPSPTAGAGKRTRTRGRAGAAGGQGMGWWRGATAACGRWRPRRRCGGGLRRGALWRRAARWAAGGDVAAARRVRGRGHGRLKIGFGGRGEGGPVGPFRPRAFFLDFLCRVPTGPGTRQNLFLFF